MRCVSVLIRLILLINVLNPIRSAKILAIFPFPGPSQYIAVQPYLKTLAARGHEVTVINGFPQKEKIKNFRDIPVLEIHDKYNEIIEDFSEHRNLWEVLNFMAYFGENFTEKIMNNRGVQKLLKSNEHFDLVIVEPLFNDALYGFGQHFNASLIAISTFGTNSYIDELVGNPSPASCAPLVTTDLTYRMNFWQRLKNLAMVSLELIHYHTVALPKQVHLYKQYFPDAKIDLLDLRKRFSLVLVNQHFSLSFPRPYVPNMVEVGGFHLHRTAKPLPPDMEEFINSSKNGVIYFSLGSNVQSKSLPKAVIATIVKTFESLPVNVMWKFEDENLPGKPGNVYISKWFPQPDILSHPNVKLFITHGGLLSTIEAIYHGKPIIGIPFFFDQLINVERAKNDGYGVGVDLATLTVAGFKAKIEQILYNPSYTEIAKKTSEFFHDQPMDPMEKAIYWTEYVLRYKGAHHMRAAAQDLNFIQYHSLDTITVLYGGLGSIIVLIVLLTYKVIKCALVNSKCTKHPKEKKH